MGALMGTGVGLTIGFIFGSFSILRGGPGPRGALATLSQYMLSSAATFGFFMSIGSVSSEALGRQAEGECLPASGASSGDAQGERSELSHCPALVRQSASGAVSKGLEYRPSSAESARQGDEPASGKSGGLSFVSAPASPPPPLLPPALLPTSCSSGDES